MKILIGNILDVPGDVSEALVLPFAGRFMLGHCLAATGCRDCPYAYGRSSIGKRVSQTYELAHVRGLIRVSELGLEGSSILRSKGESGSALNVIRLAGADLRPGRAGVPYLL